MDALTIRGFEIETVIGVRDWERLVNQTLVVDFELPFSARAARSDCIDHAWDYGEITRHSQAFARGAGSGCRLIETFAERLAEELITRFELPAISLTVHKPSAVRGADVAVSVNRSAP